MVRETRFSFDRDQRHALPVFRDRFDDEEDDELPVLDARPKRAGKRPARKRKETRPDDRRPDRRHLAGGDWMGELDAGVRPECDGEKPERRRE